MKMRKSRGYINYGSTPRNEYTTTNKKNNTNSVAVLEYDTQDDDSTQNHRSPKRRVQFHPRHGWKRSWKANGWRAELASQQDESMSVRRYYNYVAGEKFSPLNKRKPVNYQKSDVGNGAITMLSFIMEEMNLICIYKADTRRETLSNMQSARMYIDAPDTLAVLDSAADKLDRMTDIAFMGIVFDQTCKEENRAL